MFVCFVPMYMQIHHVLTILVFKLSINFHYYKYASMNVLGHGFLFIFSYVQVEELLIVSRSGISEL